MPDNYILTSSVTGQEEAEFWKALAKEYEKDRL